VERPGIHEPASRLGPPPEPKGPLRQLWRELAALSGFASHYLSAKADSARLAAQRALLLAGFGLAGLLFAAGLVVTGAVLLVRSLAAALGELLGRAWLGELAVAVLLLAAVGGAALLLRARLLGRSRRRFEQRYAARRAAQRLHYGEDVEERAAARDRDGF
jgi:hypothetical protein